MVTDPFRMPPGVMATSEPPTLRLLSARTINDRSRNIESLSSDEVNNLSGIPFSKFPQSKDFEPQQI
ncbi:hypothetical protein TNCV_3661721 [Trichonephila clavipes]|nr:hypothetical protein TNCV_3661721 [Trichonephila clavipes]